MSRKIHVFAQTELATDCDVCGIRFDLIAGGACSRCRRVLCGQHLYGSWLRRLICDFGAPAVCVACRQQ